MLGVLILLFATIGTRNAGLAASCCNMFCFGFFTFAGSTPA